jgi:hypothetical protein
MLTKQEAAGLHAPCRCRVRTIRLLKSLARAMAIVLSMRDAHPALQSVSLHGTWDNPLADVPSRRTRRLRCSPWPERRSSWLSVCNSSMSCITDLVSASNFSWTSPRLHAGLHRMQRTDVHLLWEVRWPRLLQSLFSNSDGFTDVTRLEDGSQQRPLGWFSAAVTLQGDGCAEPTNRSQLTSTEGVQECSPGCSGVVNARITALDLNVYCSMQRISRHAENRQLIKNVCRSVKRIFFRGEIKIDLSVIRPRARER